MDIDELFHTYADDVFNYLVYMTKSRDLAEDLTQETFIKAIRGLSKFRGGNPKIWLCQIARNTAIDMLRKDKGMARVDADISQIPNGEKTPEEIVESKQSADHVLSVFEELKPEYRDVIVCRTVMDMSSKDTANVLGWSSGRVRVTLHRALTAARRVFEERGL